MGGVEIPENVPTRRRLRRVLRKVLLVAVVVTVPLAGFFGTVFVIAYRDAAHGNAGQLAFANPLAVPPVLEPRVDAAGRKHFDLDLRTGRRELLPGRATTTWGVNGDFLGPTLRVRRGDDVAVHVTNNLPESTSLHWHGMRLPARMDGGPHQEIEPGTTWSPEWTVKQPAASLWYHPHLHGRTAAHVYRGVSGMFLVDDAVSDTLPHDHGVDDVPLIVQDKRFTPDGQFDLDTGALARAVGAEPAGPLGDQILVNGTHDPHFTVTSTLTRLRVLNGSTARIYHLGFTDDRPFQVVGTDTGLLPAPQQVRRVVVAPGERVEVVVAMGPGERTVLRSFPGGIGTSFPDTRMSGADDTFDVLQLRAADTLRPSPAVPSTLSTEPRVEAPVGARERELNLGGQQSINGNLMDPGRVDQVVTAGAREIWTVHGGGAPHSLHIHDVAFRILSLDGAPPPAWLAGRKDTVYLPPGSTARLAVEFGTDTDEKTPYMYHCHMLRHEDNGMMGQFVVVTPGRENHVDTTLATHGH
jgi:FtsP/CotA-like multicopper oxidase with cupredoxin domain